MSDYRKSLRRNLRKNMKSAQKKDSNAQAVMLSGLNVIQVLDDHAPKYLQSVLHYGPNTFVGKRWASALIWYRRKGYDNYQTLTLFGVWLAEQNQETNILIGTKRLSYSAAIFSAESYNAVIKTTFKPYYGDHADPPDASRIIYQTEFDITRRLALRRELADKIIHWLKHTVIDI